MKARSLVFDLFGDYLRYRGGEVRLQHLVTLLDSCGIPEATVRVIATRLRKEGWLDSRRDGRETVYFLAEPSWKLLNEGRDRIFNRRRGPWDGQWHMIIYSVPESERAIREQLRKKLAWCGFGPLSSSVYLSPHNRVDEVKLEFADQPVAKLDTFRSRSEGLLADRDFAARAWDLAGLDRDYVELLRELRPSLARYRSGTLRGADALAERMRLVHDYRHFPFRDPDLPAELLPADWHGHQAHDAFLEAHGLLRAAADGYVDEVLALPSGSVKQAG